MDNVLVVYDIKWRLFWFPLPYFSCYILHVTYNTDIRLWWIDDWWCNISQMRVHISLGGQHEDQKQQYSNIFQPSILRWRIWSHKKPSSISDHFLVFICAEWDWHTYPSMNGLNLWYSKYRHIFHTFGASGLVFVWSVLFVDCRAADG